MINKERLFVILIALTLFVISFALAWQVGVKEGAGLGFIVWLWAASQSAVVYYRIRKFSMKALLTLTAIIFQFSFTLAKLVNLTFSQTLVILPFACFLVIFMTGEQSH